MLIDLFSNLLHARPDLSALPPVPEWPCDEVLALAHHHLLAPRFCRVLREARALEQLPGLAQESLLHAVLESAQTHALYRALLPRLVKHFEAEGLRWAVLKGLAVAHSYYPQPEDRPFLDLDLLFEPEARAKVEALLERLDFSQDRTEVKVTANTHKSVFRLKSNPAFIVECHFQLSYGRFEIKPDWRQLRTLSLDGLRLPMLSVADEYLFLVFHAGVQHRFQKLGWLLDLAQIHRSAVPLDAGAVQARARKAQLLPALEMAHYFLSRFAGVELQNVVPMNTRLDDWFERIANGEVELSNLRKAQLRAYTSGGWITLLRYGAERQWARLRRPGSLAR